MPHDCEHSSESSRTELSKDQGAIATVDPLSRMVAHEVRNLLTPARIAAQSALDSSDDIGAMKQALGRTIRVCDQISTITDALLAGSSIERSPQCLDEIIQDAVSICQQSTGGYESVVVEPSDGLIVETAPVAVRHILLNLVSNALKATRRRPRSVRVFASRSTGNTGDGAPHSVQITVQDDGPGFSDNVLTQINRPPASMPSHARHAADTLIQSQGVGLEVARRLAQRIGATLVAHNLTGGGASVTITLERPIKNMSNAA